MFWFFKKHKVDPKKNLRDVLGSYTLPSFPDVTMAILEMLRDPSHSAADVEKVLASDPGLSVKVLQTANSAAFSPAKKTERLIQAITMLGMGPLESLVLSVSVGSLVPKTDARGYNQKRFWQASARRASVARSLAEILHPSTASESFTAGLLQDMATPFLAEHMPDEYGPILEQSHEGDVNLIDLEYETFGWTHAEVATWLCSEWGLPESLSSAIGGHHGNRNIKYDCPPAVSLSAYLRENENMADVEKLANDANTKYGLDESTTLDLVQESFENSKGLAQLIS